MNRTAVALLTLGALFTGSPPIEARGARSFKSGPIQITADGADVWLVNPDHDSVSHLDPATEVVTEYRLPPGIKHAPKGLSVREDGAEVWVACHDSDLVLVLAGRGPTRGTVLDTIPMPYGSGPYSVALARDQTRALVTLHRKESLAVIDAASHALVELGPVYFGSLGIVWVDDDVSAWVTHVFADGEHPFFTRVDFSGPEPKVKSKIRVLPAQPQNSNGHTAPRPAEGGYLTHRGHIAQLPANIGRRELWLPTQYNNIHNDQWDADSTVQATIRHLELTTRALPNRSNTGPLPHKVILSAVAVHDPTGSFPYQGPGWDAQISGPIDLGFSADGLMAYLLNELSNDLLVFPTSTPSVKPGAAPPLVEVAVGSRPIGLAVAPNTDLAYVANLLSRDVSIIDLAANPPVEIRRIGSTPVTTEPLAPPVLRGAQLFHTSDDPRISVNAKVACASCHINAEHDGRQWSFQNLPTDHGNRSVQTLLGLNLTFAPIDPLTGFGQLHLSGDRDEIQDFEHTFRGPMMAGTGFIRPPLTPCPDVNPPDPLCTNAGRDSTGDLDAIADYLLSLEPLHRSPWRNSDGTLTEAAIRGLTFFLGTDRANRPADANCAACHLPPRNPTDPAVFADLLFHDIGDRRGGEEELNNRGPWNFHVGTQPLVGVFATPNWEGTANFPRFSMVDLLKENAGRATRPNPHGSPDGLTRRQMRDLADFVLSIDGDTNAAEMQQVDLTPPRIERVSPTSLSRLEVWFSESIDPTSATDPSHYRILSGGGAVVPILGATYDPQNGDHVSLAVQFDPCADQAIEVAGVGAIEDLADTATGGTANRLDPADPRNTHRFTIGTTMTVTLGASGYENITVAVHDGATISNLTNWGHDSVWIGGNNVGFVRFDWASAFVAATGISSSAELVDAAVTLHGDWGDTQPIEVRRTLQAWSDTAPGDFSNSPTGAPTWNSHAHPNRWNTPGARALGGTGGVVSDYGAGWDRAAVVDVALVPQAINEPVVFSSPQMADAFRFWFDNPMVDYGYAFEVVGGNGNELKYHNWEFELQQIGPVLTLTYRLPPAPAAPGEVSGRGSSVPLYVAKTTSTDLRYSFQSLGPAATSYNIYAGTIGNWYSHTGTGCGLTPSVVGSRLELLQTPASASRYFIVTGSNACAEGPSDLDHPPVNLDCAP